VVVDIPIYNFFVVKDFPTPVADAAARLAVILNEERPDVVITYDEKGFYGHPDHIQANRVTLAAVEMAAVTPKLYYATIPKSVFERMGELMAAAGIEVPEPDEAEERPDMGTEDQEIGAILDLGDYADIKRAALAAHASQTADSFFLKMPPEVFRTFFTQEWFVRVQDPTGQVGVEDDLFAGVG
jgi:LmbE family N-acetylglucosaminyl deacetylase